MVEGGANIHGASLAKLARAAAGTEDREAGLLECGLPARRSPFGLSRIRPA